MKQIYLDALFTGLIPVKDCKAIDGGLIQGTVKSTIGAYKKGDIVKDFPRYFVNKAKSRGFHIMVTTANIQVLP